MTIYSTDHLSDDDLQGFHRLNELTDSARFALAAIVNQLASHPRLAVNLAQEARAYVYRTVDMYRQGYSDCFDEAEAEIKAARDVAKASRNG